MLSSVSHVQGVWAWRKWRRVTHQTVKYHLRLWEPANDFGDASSLRHRFLALSPLLVGIGSKNINSLFFFPQVNFPPVKSSSLLVLYLHSSWSPLTVYQGAAQGRQSPSYLHSSRYKGTPQAIPVKVLSFISSLHKILWASCCSKRLPLGDGWIFLTPKIFCKLECFS